MRHLLTSFGGTAVVQLCNIATGILAARLLLPEGRGEMAAILLWPTIIATVVYSSLDQGIMFHAARQPAKTSAYLSAGLGLAAPLGVVALAIGLLVMPLAYTPYGEAIATLSVAYMVIMVPFMYAGQGFNAVLQGRQRFDEWNVLRVAQPILYLILVVAFAAVGAASVAAFVLSGLAAGAVLLPVLIWIVVRRLDVRPGLPRRAELRSVGAYSLSVHVSAVLGLAGGRLDQMAIALLLTPAELGLYAVALALGGVSALFNATIFSLAYPKITAQPTAEGKAIVLGRYLRLSLGLGLFSGVAVAVLAPMLLALLFGDAFVPAATVATFLAFAACARGGGEMFAIGFRAAGAPRYANLLSALSLVVSALSLIVLIPLFGLVGAAAARLTVQVVASLVGLAITLRLFGTSLGQLLKPTRAEWQLALDQTRMLLRGFRGWLQGRSQ